MNSKVNTPAFALAFAAKRRANDRLVRLIKLTPEKQESEDALGSIIVNFFGAELLTSFLVKRIFCFHGVAPSDLDLDLVTTEHTQSFDIDDFREFSIRHLASEMIKGLPDSYKIENEDQFSRYSEETLDVALSNLIPLGYFRENSFFNVFAYSDEGVYHALRFTVTGQPPVYKYETFESTEPSLLEFLRKDPVAQTC